MRAQDRVTKLQEQAQQQKRRIEDLQRALATANQAEEKVQMCAVDFLRHGLRRKSMFTREVVVRVLARDPFRTPRLVYIATIIKHSHPAFSPD